MNDWCHWLSSSTVHEVDVPYEDSNRPSLMALDATGVRRWYKAAFDSLTIHRRTVDELNVFPVPDGDTGTNMVATMGAACEALTNVDAGTELTEMASLAARGALLGARGNSGVILAQILHGLADEWQGKSIDAQTLVRGLQSASQSAFEAVASPAEGTILTVMRAAANAAQVTDLSNLGVVCRQVCEASVKSLSATVDQLPALTRAGVVDAGGLGLALILEALCETVTGSAPRLALSVANPGFRAQRSGAATEVPREAGSVEFGYEVQYLVDAESDAVDRLRDRLAELGDSVVVVGAAASSRQQTHTWNVHVHVNDVGAAVEAGIESGRLYRLSVTRFADQPVPGPSVDRDSAQRRGIVVLAEGVEFAEILRSEGAYPVTMPHPATQDILSAIRECDTADVIVMVDQSNQAVAESAAELARADHCRVSVIPLRSAVQSLAALAVADDSRRFDDEAIAMAEAAGACRNAEVTVAARAALTSVGRCEPGDFLGIADGDVLLFGNDLDNVLRDLADRLCAAGVELLTVVTGANVSSQSVDNLEAHLRSSWPMVGVQRLVGGQPRHLIWIGAE